MLPQSIKNKVATLWDKFWSGGIANPLNAIEQITYLLFMKQLDETDAQKVSNADFLDEKHASIFLGKYFPPGMDPGVKYKGNSSFDSTYIKNPLHIELDHTITHKRTRELQILNSEIIMPTPL